MAWDMEFLTLTERRDLIRLMSKAGGRRTEFFYELFAELNRQFFNDQLPTPLITTEITPYGKCLGLTLTGGEMKIPHVRVHPAICDSAGKCNKSAWSGVNPWTIHTLMVHEMTHISQKMPHLSDKGGETSHNAANWVEECNRMSEAWDLPRACRRWVVKRTGKSTARLPDYNEPTADAVLEGLRMDNVSRWPDGVAEVIHSDVSAWAESCVKRLGLPTF